MRKLFVFLAIALLCYNLSANHEHLTKRFTQEYNIQKCTLQSSKKHYEQTFFISIYLVKKVLARHLCIDSNAISALEINLMLGCILIYVPIFLSSPATRLLHRIRSPSKQIKKPSS